MLVEQPQCRELLRPNKTDYRLLSILFFLSFFELPVKWIGKDAIGLYDIYLGFMVLYLLFRTRGFTMQMSWVWRSYFLVFFGYLAYLFLILVYFTDFRSGAILLKDGEAMLAMAILYTYYTRFDLDLKRVARLIEINLVLLCLFQIYSFIDNLHPVGPIPPGLGIGLWYRLSLPLMYGVSSNPAGFVAGTFILFNIYARNRRLIPRATFLFVTFLLVVCLLFTVSRTNILVTVFILVVYLLRRSFTRTRYIIAIAVFGVFLIALMNFLVDRIPEDTIFWNFLKLVQHPSDFLSRIRGDESFSLRYGVAWPDQLRWWLTNIYTFFFGNGIAFIPVADGTYTGLLCNQGLIGLSFFLYVWYIHFFSVWKSKLPFLWILFLYVLLNGTTADTLVTSYRTVQAYLVALFFILFAYGGIREQEQRPMLLSQKGA